jgi:hypothetical protein
MIDAIRDCAHRAAKAHSSAKEYVDYARYIHRDRNLVDLFRESTSSEELAVEIDTYLKLLSEFEKRFHETYDPLGKHKALNCLGNPDDVQSLSHI